MRFLSFLPMLLFATLLSAQNDCQIIGLNATVSTIDPVSCQYSVVLNFQHTGTTNQYTVQGNGNNYGTFPYNQVPVTLGPFTAGNTATTREFVVRDLIFQNCAAEVVVTVPACSTTAGCHITNMVVTPGDCQPNSPNYNLTLNFQVTAPTNTLFDVKTVGGQILGTFPLSSLPVLITNFPASGNANDAIRVCINDNPNCCETKEFAAPDCNVEPTCNIYDMVVTPGDCVPGSANYNLTLDFEVTGATNALFDVWAGNNQHIGTYQLSALPIQISNFPASGNAFDAIRVCINDNPNCCKVKEFAAPDCNVEPTCNIYDMVVTPGDCVPGSANYNLTLDFEVTGATNALFDVWAGNNQHIGTYQLSALPIQISNFPASGNAFDAIRVCINDNPNCCKVKEFAAPDCNGGTPCEIVDMVVTTGPCNDATYALTVDFELVNASNIDSFTVFANGAFFGRYLINLLPLTIPNFPYNGGANDVIKVCVANDQTECCRTREFAVPDCIYHPCEISQIFVETGPCTSNTTYQLFVNFSYTSPTPVDSFIVFANGSYFGTYGTNQLPLTIPNFPYNGGANDVIKIYLGTNAANGCVKTLEFPVPDCLNNTNPCHIYDLVAVHTPCLCGQFFAVLNFQFDNVGSGGFDIVGNGNNYGTFGYDHPQPIILGPFPGDGNTNYEFVVRDHFHPDCHDAVEMGEVVCMTPVNDPGNTALLSISPNPANEWVQVSAQLNGGVKAGQSNVEVYATDGRLVMHQTVADGGNFQLNVSALPAGVYRLIVRSEAGNVEGTFARK